MRITRIAYTTDQNRNKITDLESDIRSIKRDLKSFKSEQKEISKEITEIQKTLKDLNIGNRLYFQNKTIFTSLQRKIEKLEKVELEWKKYKETLDKKLKSIVTKKDRASVSL